MSEFLAAILEPFAGFCLRVWRLFSFFRHADEVMKESSSVGESEMDREARRSWLSWGTGCLIVLILAVVAAGVSFWWWNG